MGNRLKNKVAIVTGSGQGIGRAIALALATEGASIVTNNRKRGSTGYSIYGDEFAKKLAPEDKAAIDKVMGDAETTAQEIIKMGGKALPFFGDVADFNTAGDMIKAAVNKFGKIDILVNNAGAVSRAFIWDMSEQAWDLVLNSKLRGSYNCIRHASPIMKEQKWGRIINCTSGAWLGGAEICNYSTANAGIVGLTRSVAREVAKYGITCNAFAPVAPTRMFLNQSARVRMMEVAGTPIMAKERWAKFVAEQGTVEGLAPLIVYLATDEASYINGSVFYASGTGKYGIYTEEKIKKSINKRKNLWTIDELVKVVPETILKGYKMLPARH